MSQEQYDQNQNELNKKTFINIAHIKIIKMQVKKILIIDQTSDDIEQLTIKYNTAKSTCGYIVCALCQYLAEQDNFTQEIFKQINFNTLKPYIEKAMQTIAKSRRLEVKKFMNKMNETQKKNYMTDWVANFELSDYLEGISDKVVNHQVYFFRQSAYDHPKALELVKFEQAERVKQEQQFKGGLYFYTSFNPQENHKKQNFIEELKKNHSSKQPIIIATDVLGHFNTTVIIEGRIYVLDSLPNVQGQYDSGIVEAIAYYFKTSYLKQ